MSIRIVFISDTHNYHSKVNLPPGDILIHCGDATSIGRVSEITSFGQWFKAQPFPHKIFVVGNHEISFERNFGVAKALLNFDRTQGEYLLFDEGCEVEGIKIWGNSWQNSFCGWAFGVDTEEELALRYDNIPMDTDILVTHSPPYGILDQCADGRKVGSKALLAKVSKVQPKVNCFGHIHEAYGYETHAATTYINASICNVYYEPKNKPIVYDWDLKQVA